MKFITNLKIEKIKIFNYNLYFLYSFQIRPANPIKELGLFLVNYQEKK
jgi:hypothetical protein